MRSFELLRILRRIRRAADLSQRELALRLGLSTSTIAAVETGKRGLEVAVLVDAAAPAGLRLALLDAAGVELPAAVPEWACNCPRGCDATRDVTRQVHVQDCPCRCDIA